MEFENIELSNLAVSVALVTVNRPSKLNSLNKKTIFELHQVFAKLSSDKSVGVVVLTGKGEKAFVAGADISEFAHFSKEEGALLASEGQDNLFDLIENFPKPVIAAINGFALGGGLELAMAAHFRFAAENAQMGLPEVYLGVIPGYGGTQRLPQLIGKGRAMEIILTGAMISAEKALEYGLVNKILPQKDLLSACLEVARKILKNSPNAIRVAIKAINTGFKIGEDGFKREIELFGSCFGTDDFIEGTTAFMGKRRPDFDKK